MAFCFEISNLENVQTDPLVIFIAPEGNVRERLSFRKRVKRADCLHSSSKNGVAQMFIIADLRKGKKHKAVILLSAPETVCINLNGNCGGVSRHARFSTLASPSYLFYFLNKSPPLAVCYPAPALPISRDFRHLLPFRGVLDGVFTSTPPSIRLVREVGNLEFQNASFLFLKLPANSPFRRAFKVFTKQLTVLLCWRPNSILERSNDYFSTSKFSCFRSY